MAGNRLPVLTEISAGGVVARAHCGQQEVALISVGSPPRWQLPKGLLDPGEAPEAAAAREVQEETGIEGELIRLLDAVEYWYVSAYGGIRPEFTSSSTSISSAGDVGNHDQEVHDARWFPIDEAIRVLAFSSERKVVEKARELLKRLVCSD